MQKPLEYFVPKWAMAKVCGRTCSCGHEFVKEDIIGIGVRKLHRKNKWIREALAIESWCPTCNKGGVTTFAIDDLQYGFRELLCALLQEVQKNDELEQIKKVGSTGVNNKKISRKEMRKFMDYLRDVKTHEDFIDDMNGEENI